MTTTTDTVTLEQLLGRMDRLDERLTSLIAALSETRPDLAQPEECQQQVCGYYTYLAYGPAELTHEGFHAAECMARQHIDGCSHRWEMGPCPTCLMWERRLRA